MKPALHFWRSPRGPMRTAQNLLLSLVSLILFLTLTEVLLRLLGWDAATDQDFRFYARQVHGDLEIPFNEEDPDLMWRPKPNYHEGFVHINSEGYRDRLYRQEKPPGTIRILCLGDSSTFGWRLPAEQTYTKVLEKTLNSQRDLLGTRFEVVNFGVTGYTSAQGLGLFLQQGTRLSPDVVIFAFGTNDPVRSYSLSDEEIMSRSAPRLLHRVSQRLVASLRLYRFMRAAWLRNPGRDMAGQDRVPRVSISAFRENLLKMQRLCERHGSRLLALSPPLSKERDFQPGDSFLPSKPELIAYRRALEETAAAIKIPVVTLDELSERSPISTEQYFLDVVHPNRLGHELIAARLSAAIAGMLATR